MFGKLGKESEEQAEKREEQEAKDKADYINEKLKLSEKELLAEILYRLENIYDVLYSDSTKPRIPRK